MSDWNHDPFGPTAKPNGKGNGHINDSAAGIFSPNGNGKTEAFDIPFELQDRFVRCIDGVIRDAAGNVLVRREYDDGANIVFEITPPSQPTPTDGKNPWLHDLEPITTLDFARLADNPPFERDWAIQDWFPMLETVGFGGPAGEGKTLLAQMFGTAAALAEGCLGLPCSKEMKAALVLCEDRHNDAYLRQADINRAFGCRMSDLAGRLKIYPRRNNQHNYLGIFDQDGALHLTSFFDQLLADIKAFGAKWIVLDTRADVFRGNQNDEAHARTFVRKVCDRFAWETEGLCFLLYQPSRAGRVDGTGESGNAQWDAAFRCRTYIDPARKDDDPGIRYLVRKKSNFSAKNEEIKIRWNKGVFIRADAAEAAKPAYEVAAQQMKAERVFLTLLDRFSLANRKVSAKKTASNYAPKEFSARGEQAEGCTVEDLARAMDSLLLDKHSIRIDTTGRFDHLVKVVEHPT
jgi:RecA-family ATPase